MIRLFSNRAPIRVLLCLAALSAPATSAELSPWLGSMDQAPFQLDAKTMLAVTTAQDPIQTGSISKISCPPKGCITPSKPATDGSVGGGAPQN